MMFWLAARICKLKFMFVLLKVYYFFSLQFHLLLTFAGELTMKKVKVSRYVAGKR